MENTATPLNIAATLERMRTLEDYQLLSEGFSEDLERLEAAIHEHLKAIKERRDEVARQYCRDRGHDVDNYGARQVRVANSDMYITVRAPSAVKFVDGNIDDVDPQFVKVEKKLDTTAINAYKKVHNTMPKGVLEEMRGGGSVSITRKEEMVKKEIQGIKNPLKGIKFSKK